MGTKPSEQEWTSRFEDDPAVIYVLDRDFRLRYCNAAWDRFAVENGGAPQLLRERQIGRDVMLITPVPLIRFYSALFNRVLNRHLNADHIYDCSSPNLIRQFHMHVQRLETPRGAPSLLVVNSLLKEQPLPEGEWGDSDALRHENGSIVMCAHCRRTLVPNSAELWVWVAEYVRETPKDAIHSLCGVCFGGHYTRAEDSAR